VKSTLSLILLLLILLGCSSGIIPSATTSTPIPPTPTSTFMTVLSGLKSPTPTFSPNGWKTWPIVPIVSSPMIDVYQVGMEIGRDPNRFSKVGDCQNVSEQNYFLSNFDHSGWYSLGTEYASLQSTIDNFAGSWSRVSLAVKGGQNVAAALNPFWADPSQCKPNETPVACEIRVYNPSIVIISLEEHREKDTIKYNVYLRQIVEYILSQSVVPLLATRAELPNNPTSINSAVTQIAHDYNVPLWNFWAAADPLPSHGVRDGFHLTSFDVRLNFFFDNPESMKTAWPWRNLTALQAVDAIFHAVSNQP
jgi:hypothetical protein